MNFKNQKFTYFLGILIIFAIGIFVGNYLHKYISFNTEQERIEIGLTPSPANTLLYIALNQGFFSKFGIDIVVKPYSSGLESLKSLTEKNLDMTLAADTPTAKLALTDKDFRIIGTIARSNRQIALVSKNHQINNVEDLIGKRVGIVPNTTSEYFIHALLTHQNINPKKMTFINIAPHEAEEALDKAKVDVVSVWQPIIYRIEKKHKNQISKFYGPDFYNHTWNILIRPELMDNPDLLTRFIKALAEANDFFKKNPETSIQTASKYTRIDPAHLHKMFSSMDVGLGLDQSLIYNLEKHSNWLIKHKNYNVSNYPNFFRFIDTTFLKSVIPDEVTIIN